MEKIAPYLLELRFQAALVQQFDETLRVGSAAKDFDGIWRPIHGLLSAAANLSKLLWPASRDPARRERGAWLRKELGIDDTSPLRVRTMRDHLEHFDERLDDWVSTAPERMVDRLIDDMTGQRTKALRHFETGRWVVPFRSFEAKLAPIVEATAEIGRRAEALLDPILMSGGPPTETSDPSSAWGTGWVQALGHDDRCQAFPNMRDRIA